MKHFSILRHQSSVQVVILISRSQSSKENIPWNYSRTKPLEKCSNRPCSKEIILETTRKDVRSLPSFSYIFYHSATNDRDNVLKFIPVEKFQVLSILSHFVWCL